MRHLRNYFSQLKLRGFIIIFISVNAYAQQYQLSSNIASEQGLSQNSVLSILQDESGIIWAGTKNGLNKHDGYKFTVYKNNSRDSNSLAGNVVECLLSDDEHNIWIGTGAGLSKYSITDNKFDNFTVWHSPNGLQPLPHIKTLLFENKNTLLIGTRKGLFIFLLDQRKILHAANLKKYELLKDRYINSIYKDSAGLLWVCTADDGLYLIDGDRINRVEFSETEQTNVTFVGRYGDSIIIGTFGGGLFKYDLRANHYATKVARRILWTSFPGQGNSGYLIQHIKLNDSTGLIITRSSLGIFDPKNDSVTTIYHAIEKSPFSSLYRDASGVIWVGTDGSGIIRFNPFLKHFKTVKQKSADRIGLSFSSVRAIHLDRQMNLLVGGYSGVNIYKNYNGNFIHEWETLNELNRFPVRSIIQDRFNDDQYWIGTEGYGLLLFNRSRREAFAKTGSIIRFLDGSEKVLSEGSFGPIGPINEIYRMFYDSGNNFYIGTDIGLIMKSFSAGSFGKDESYKLFKYNSIDNNSIVQGHIKAITEDSEGNIWIGSDRGGISVLSHKSREIRNYTSRANTAGTLSSNRINVILGSKDGSIWIGTENGLNRFNKESGSFEVFSIAEGLADDFIYGIEEDEHGNLWLSHNKGISKFLRAENTFVNFDAGYGLQSNEFNTLAYVKSANGEIFFGGIKGITAFYPDEITLSTYQPKIILTNFKKFNIDANLPGFPLTNELNLSYKEDFFSFEFSSSDYFDPSRIRFRYMLEGFHHSWIYLDANQRSLSLTNLDAGECNLIINSTNSDGIWSDKPRKIKITITPAFYDTLYFRLSVVLLIIISATVLVKRTIKKIEKDKELQHDFLNRLIAVQEEERDRIAGELHDSIGQDILIAKNKLKINDGSDSVTNMSEVDGILSGAISDLSKISHDLRPSELDDLGLTTALESMIERVSENSGVDFKYELINSDNYFDKRGAINLYRVIQEAVSNVLKHSKANSAVLKSYIDNNNLIIEIIDNGIGISQRITAEDNRPHLGFSSMKARIKLLNGEISFSPGDKEGTIVRITLALPFNHKEN